MTPSVYARYRQTFVDALAAVLEMPASELSLQVKPAEPAHGDLSLAMFPFAKTMRKAPAAIAAAIAPKVAAPGLTVAATGPYVNARFNADPFTAEVIESARGAKQFGSSDSGAGKTMVIDFSSPNIAKPIAFHHIRSTVIGHALVNLYRCAGWRVEGINYLGDWGKQFGLVAVGLEKFGDHTRHEDIGHLVDVYVRANEAAKNDSAFDDRARAFFRAMEENHEPSLKIWKELRDISIRAFKTMYDRLGIAFDHYDGESLYQGRMEAVIDEVAAKVGTKESQGALIVDMPYPEGEPPVMLRKRDGSTLYATRDLAAAEDRYERFKFNRSLYVVAQDQALHFRQFFAVLARMGKPWAKDLIHVHFGRVMGMSTRKGNLVLLGDVLDEAAARARVKVDENIAAGRLHTDDPAKLAEQIGLGAIVFGDLKNRRASDYEFDWEELLSFVGHTGVYLQFAHARACSILRKSGSTSGYYDATLLTLPEEQTLVRMVARLPVVIEEAVEDNEPSLVARHLLDIGAAFHGWFTLGNQDPSRKVLVEGHEPMRAARLALTDAVRIALASGLALLGVPAPEQM